MRRRAFIAGLGSAAAWPLAARAQQPKVPVVGFLNIGAPEGPDILDPSFRKGLNETGFTEDRSVTIEYRFANNAGAERLAELAADLPVQQATKFELVINLKTAKALGLTIPETLLATADEVIQ